MVPSQPPHTFHYDGMPCQAGELFLPAQSMPPIVCLLHGGFWRTPWGREQMVPLALDLQQRGFAVWNLGYRRVGENGGGWPGTFEDAAAGIDHLAELAGNGVALNLKQLYLVGHSAGGLLALWSSARGNTQRVRPSAVAGLAPITNLARCFAQLNDPDLLNHFLGDAADKHETRYGRLSPLHQLPLGLPQAIIHGAEDEAVPFQDSQDYVLHASNVGDEARLIVPAGAKHMAFLDPASSAHAALCGWLAEMYRDAL